MEIVLECDVDHRERRVDTAFSPQSRRPSGTGPSGSRTRGSSRSRARVPRRRSRAASRRARRHRRAARRTSGSRNAARLRVEWARSDVTPLGKAIERKRGLERQHALELAYVRLGRSWCHPRPRSESRSARKLVARSGLASVAAMMKVSGRPLSTASARQPREIVVACVHVDMLFVGELEHARPIGPSRRRAARPRPSRRAGSRPGGRRTSRGAAPRGREPDRTGVERVVAARGSMGSRSSSVAGSANARSPITYVRSAEWPT